MLRCICCKNSGFSSSTESVVGIVWTECPAGQEEENACETLRQVEAEQPLPAETRREEGLLKKEVQGSLFREKHGDLSCVSRSLWEVGRHENVRDESITEAQGQRANTGVSEAASGSAPKLDSLARETTISTPSVEDRTLVEDGHLGPPEEGAADKTELRSRRESFPSQVYHQRKNRNLVLSKTLVGVDNGSLIYEQTEHEPMPGGVLSVTAERKTEPNLLSVGTKTMGTHYQEERTREVDEGGECDLPSNNSESPYHLNSQSIKSETTECHRGTPDYQNSHSINTDTTEYHRGKPDYQNSHSINIDTTEYHRGTPDYQNSYKTTSDTTDYPSPLSIKSGNENRTSQDGNQGGLHSPFDCENQPTCRKISCLYNQTGFLFTVGGERHVWTLLGMAIVLVRTHVTESEGATVGCRLVWRGRVPVPISELPDMTEVQFDAVVFSQTKVFHTLVIWREVKPYLVIEPPPATYIFINGLGVSVSRFVSLKQMAYVEVNFEGRTVNSEVTKDLVFFNGKRASSSDMSLMSSFPPGQVFATVCKMMKGDAVGTVTYTFECVWYGKRPQVDLLPTDFKRGKVYMQEPRGRYIRDHKLQHLYCDVPATLKAHGQSCMLTFCMGKETIRVPVNLKLLHFKENRIVSLPPSDLPVKAHVVKFWGKSFWKVLMVQLLSRQDSVVAPHDSGVVSRALTSTVNSPGPSQPQESADFGNMPVRSVPDSADGRGSLTPMIWVEGCLWNLASISQGIATLINKSILIKQDRFYVDGVKVRESEPLAKFFSKDALVNAVIEPQFRPIEVLGKTVTHRAIVAWLGTKPQDIDTFLESDLGEPFTKYDFPDNSKPMKKTFVVERNHDCPTPATDTHGPGMANGAGNDICPVEVSSDKVVSYAGSCNWKVATISLGIIAHAKKTIVVQSSAFFVDQVRVSGSDPLVRFTFNDTPVNAEVVALSSAHPVLGYTATHEALLAWQGERPLEADNIIADYYIAGKPRENQSSGVTVHRTGSKRSVFLKDIEERISSSCTTTDGSADGAIINNVAGKLYKIGIDYGILRLQCRSIKESNTLVLFHPSVAYVDKKRLSSNKPLDQQLNLSNPRLWQCKIQECVAKTAEVTVQYKAILIWQGKKPSEEEIAQQDSESQLRAADEAEWRNTRKDHEKNIVNSDKIAKAADASSEALHTPSTPSDEDEDVSRAQVRGKLTLLNAKRGRLHTHTGQYINFKRNQCLLYGIRLDNVQLHHVLRTGESVECRLGKNAGGVWQVEVLWAGGELLPLDPCFGYAQLHLWCRDHNVPSEDLATLLHEAGYDEEAAPATASTTDKDFKSINMTLSTAAVGNESDILHLNGEQWMSPDLFPTAGDERSIVQVDGKDWMSPDLFLAAAAGDEKCIVQLDGNDWMSPDLFPLAAAGDERDIVQLAWGF